MHLVQRCCSSMPVPIAMFTPGCCVHMCTRLLPPWAKLCQFAFPSCVMMYWPQLQKQQVAASKLTLNVHTSLWSLTCAFFEMLTIQLIVKARFSKTCLSTFVLAVASASALFCLPKLQATVPLTPHTAQANHVPVPKKGKGVAQSDCVQRARDCERR